MANDAASVVGGGHTKQPEWYCVMAVKGGCVRDFSQQEQQQRNDSVKDECGVSSASSAIVAAPGSEVPSLLNPNKRKVKPGSVRDAVEQPSQALVEEGYGGVSAELRTKTRKVNKKRRIVSKRTKLYISTDPCGSLKEDGDHSKDADVSPYKLVTVIGPLASESEALIVDKIWNFRSRGPVPRAFWGLGIAEWFGLNIWMSMQDLFPAEVLAVRQDENGKVFLDARGVINT
jgi:hypothetical protein